ncbi:MAG: phosphate propanoyltransferase [Bacilli bacterium]|jgi:putative phosphotransacetylase|nr:phosphate propanoyltransferase [Bacilli bacterium]
MKVTVGISNRHVHVTKEHLEILFGENYELQVLRPVNQPGQFASVEKVSIETSKSKIDGVRILGPVRPYTQVEVSKTDAIKLGLNPPVRDSGDLKGSEPITIIGPCGKVEIEEGCILATRHIHMTPEKRKELGLEAVSKVAVKIEGEKGGMMKDVHIKSADASYYEMHIDTDDANAFLLTNNDEVEILIGKEYE